MRKSLACIALLLFALVSSTSAMAQRAETVHNRDLYTFEPRAGTEERFFRLVECQVVTSDITIVIRGQRFKTSHICARRPPNGGNFVDIAYGVNGGQRWFIHQDIEQWLRSWMQRQGRPWPFDTVRL